MRLSDLDSVDRVETALRSANYLPDEGLAAAVFLATQMRRPLLLEGEAGVGKTQLARTLARLMDSELIRLQCYEGIDAQQALYEWNYPRQLLALREIDAAGVDAVDEVYGQEYLSERPLLKALRKGEDGVLLIDELDRADDQFEAFLLEFLSDFSISIPELGTVSAAAPPLVVITSNRTRELHDALKRRCLFHWIAYPDHDREVEIIRRNAPEVSDRLAASVAAAISRLRTLGLTKNPGPAEAIDWSRGVAILGAEDLTAEVAEQTLGWAVKNEEDLSLVRKNIDHVIGS